MPGRGHAARHRRDAHDRGVHLLRDDGDLAGLHPDPPRRPARAPRRHGRPGRPARRGPHRRPGHRPDRPGRRGGRAVHPRLLASCSATTTTPSGRPRRSTPPAGCTRATWPTWTTRATSGSWDASRTSSSAAARTSRRARSRSSSTRTPTSRTSRSSASPTSATARSSARASGCAPGRRRSTPTRCARSATGRLAHFKVPRHVLVVDAFPMTVTGKVQKFVLREQAVERLGPARARRPAGRLGGAAARGRPADRGPAQRPVRLPAVPAPPCPTRAGGDAPHPPGGGVPGRIWGRWRTTGPPGTPTAAIRAPRPPARRHRRARRGAPRRLAGAPGRLRQQPGRAARSRGGPARRRRRLVRRGRAARRRRRGALGHRRTRSRACRAGRRCRGRRCRRAAPREATREREPLWVVGLPLAEAPGLGDHALVLLLPLRDTEAVAEARAEAQLRERAVLATGLSFTVADARADDLPLIFVNPAFTLTTGYTPEEVLGRNCRFLQGPETDPAGPAAIRAALEAGEEVTVTLLNRRRDGTAFWNQVSINPIRDADGDVTHFVGIQHDVTERVEADRDRAAAYRAERIARERLALLAEATSTLAATLDVDESLERLARLVVPLLADWVAIHLVDEAGGVRQVAVRHRDGQEDLLRRYAELQPRPRHRAVADPAGPRAAPTRCSWRTSAASGCGPRPTPTRSWRSSSASGGARRWSCPLEGRDRVLGSIAFVSGPLGPDFGPDELQVAVDLGRRAAITVENARLYEDARQAQAPRRAGQRAPRARRPGHERARGHARRRRGAAPAGRARGPAAGGLVRRQPPRRERPPAGGRRAPPRPGPGGRRRALRGDPARQPARGRRRPRGPADRRAPVRRRDGRGRRSAGAGRPRSRR